VDVFNILISGVGGQGVLLTSKVIAEAALLAGLDVKQSEVHGMAQRGGSVLSQVRFGDKVFSPIVSEGEADLLIGFEPLETARYLHFLKDDGVVVYNTRTIGTIGVSIAAEKYPADIDTVIKDRVKTQSCAARSGARVPAAQGTGHPRRNQEHGAQKSA
jgi:indolepyruvate ferredoxin oxidoreductase beta subunit